MERAISRCRIGKGVQDNRRAASSAFFSIFTAMIRKTILPMCYLPPISWFSAYLGSHSGNTGTPGAGDPKAHELWIESKEHFPRQSYRNRCHIHSPNGLLALSIPVQKGSGQHTALKDVSISPHHPWPKIHWRSLQAAYRSSAFFE